MENFTDVLEEPAGCFSEILCKYEGCKKSNNPYFFFFFSTQRNEVPMLGMLSIGFCGNTVKILSIGDSYSMITIELPFTSSSNLEHCSAIRFLTVENVSAVEIHRQLVNVLHNYHTHSQADCVS